jgi:cell division septal protein FtsQ
MYKANKKYKINSDKSGKYNYYHKNYHNTLFPRKKGGLDIFFRQFSWKLKLALLILNICFIALFYCFFYSKYFLIKHINIEGTKKINTNQISDLVWQQSQTNIWILLPQKNLISFSKKQLIQKISSIYNLTALEIEKKYPDIINIKIKEKDNFAIWQEGAELYYIDTEGAIINNLELSELASTSYPIIFNKGNPRVRDKQIELEKDNFNFINNLNNQFKSYKGKMDINRFIIDNEENVVKISLKQGPELIFNTKLDIEIQLNKLVALVNKKSEEDLSKILYINLKYEDKIYYQ